MLKKACLHCSWPFGDLGGWYSLTVTSNLEKQIIDIYLTTLQSTPCFPGFCTRTSRAKTSKPYLHHHLLFLPIHKPSCYITDANSLDLIVVFLTRLCYPPGHHKPLPYSKTWGKSLCSVVSGFFPPILHVLKPSTRFALLFCVTSLVSRSPWREPKPNWRSKTSLALFWVLQCEFYPSQLSKYIQHEPIPSSISVEH